MNDSEHYENEAARWKALINRDRGADGEFVYGVTTTGIYCRPDCPSRLPNRENVRFFDEWSEAEEAGFRPCKRCAPQLINPASSVVDAITEACRLIKDADREPSLDELARAVNLSPSHFHRLFKKTLGITPKQYAMEKRLARVRHNLEHKSTVIQAVYDAGYGSGSRFYETATASLGMKPAEYQKGGEGKSIRYAIVDTYLGWMLVAATEQGVCRIEFGDSADHLIAGLEKSFPQAEFNDRDSVLQAMVAQTLAFLETPEGGLALPLDVQGTAFQRRVWVALQQIPSGATVSYGEIARQIGVPKAARAVAQACASNPAAVAIPCHRVIRKDGGLGGYRWGIERKQRLLDRESRERDVLVERKEPEDKVDD